MSQMISPQVPHSRVAPEDSLFSNLEPRFRVGLTRGVGSYIRFG
jgi:hypothetical protein